MFLEGFLLMFLKGRFDALKRGFDVLEGGF
jgi:hypothetical protein